MKIVFLDRVFTSNRGGIERVCAGVANEMTRRGHECLVIAENDDPGAQPVFPVSEAVRVHNIRPINKDVDFWELPTVVCDAAPDVVVMMSGLTRRTPMRWLLPLRGLNCPFVASEHAFPGAVEQVWGPRRRATYLRAVDRIHLIMDSYTASVPDGLRGRVTVIPNPVVSANIETSSIPCRLRPKVILFIGNLLRATKQAHLLIEAFALLRDAFPDWHVEIWGDGPDWPFLLQRVEQLNVNDAVLFRGTTSDIESRYGAAQVLCMPSATEGCPCVVQEAMSHGLPVVGYAQCPGVNELVVHGENGLLAEAMTAESLAAQLRVLLDDADLRDRMGRDGREKASRFDPSLIHDQWEKMLLEAASCKGITVLHGQRSFLLRCELRLIALGMAVADPYAPSKSRILRSLSRARRGLSKFLVHDRKKAVRSNHAHDDSNTHRKS